MVNGNLPPGWLRLTIGDVTEHIQKVDPRNDPLREFFYIDISSIDNLTQKIISPKKYTGSDAPSRARQLIKTNDVLFSTVRTYLKNIALVPEVYDGQIASTGFSILRAKPKVSGKFLFFFSQTDAFLTPLNELQLGTSYPAVRDNDVREQSILFPPLPEQERIVERIESLFTQLDSGVAALKRGQVALKRYNDSVLKSACEGQLVKCVSRIVDNELPEGWQLRTLKDVCVKIQDGTHFSPKVQYDDSGIGKYLYITAKNIKEQGIVLSDVTYIDENTHRENSKRCNPKRGDVLLIKDGVTPGTATINQLNEEFTLLSSVALLRPNLELLDPNFLKYYLNSPVGYKNITGQMTGTAIKRIILAKIKTSFIPIPPLAEQHSIVTEVEQRLSIAQELGQFIEANLKRAARLRQAILKHAFEGRL